MKKLESLDWYLSHAYGSKLILDGIVSYLYCIVLYCTILYCIVTIVYRNNNISRVAEVPGFAAKHVEDKKIKADADSPWPVAALMAGATCLRPSPWRMAVGLGPMDRQR